MSLWHFHLPKEKTRLTEVNDCSQGWTGNLWQRGTWEPGRWGSTPPTPQGCMGSEERPEGRRPQGPQQSAVEAKIPDTPFPSVLFESVPVTSITEVRLPEILNFKYFTGRYCLLQMVLSTQSWMCREERGDLGAENQTALPVPHCPRGVGLRRGEGDASGPTVSRDLGEPPTQASLAGLNPLRKMNISLRTCRPWFIQVEIIIYSVKLEINSKVMF